MRVLLVEDDALWGSRAMQEISLADPNAKITWVTTIAKARSVLDEAGERSFDVAVLDCHLPDGEGDFIAREIRSKAGSETTRIVMLTTDGTDPTRARALASDVDRFLVKTAKGLELLSCVRDRKFFWNIEDLPKNIDLYRKFRGSSPLSARPI